MLQFRLQYRQLHIYTRYPALVILTVCRVTFASNASEIQDPLKFRKAPIVFRQYNIITYTVYIVLYIFIETRVFNFRRFQIEWRTHPVVIKGGNTVDV